MMEEPLITALKTIGRYSPTIISQRSRPVDLRCKIHKTFWFFSSDEKRFLKVQTVFSGLLHALAMEGYHADDQLIAFASFMNIISDTFPNWQQEYATLNDLYIEEALDK